MSTKAASLGFVSLSKRVQKYSLLHYTPNIFRRNMHYFFEHRTTPSEDGGYRGLFFMFFLGESGILWNLNDREIGKGTSFVRMNAKIGKLIIRFCGEKAKNAR